MVGIPRSKGCKTCRKRKIKCDELRPRCGPCRKGVRECEGYDAPTIFLNTSSNDFPDGSSSSAPGQKVVRFKNHFVEDVAWQHGHEVQLPVRGGRKGDATAALVARYVPPSSSRTTSSSSNNSSRRVEPYAARRLKRVDVQKAWSAPAPRNLNTRIWAVENILSQFLETCLPPEATQESPLGWVASLVPMKKDVDALPLAMSALAFGWAGHVNAQPQLVDKALQLYNAAIQQLRHDLTTCSPLQMLAATALFVIFELCEFGSKGNPGWQTHMQGIAAVLLSLGPEKVSEPPYVQIYAFCRVIFCVQGLRLRKRICASSPLWMEGPFRNYKKDPLKKLIDLMAISCELFERADALEQGEVGIEALEGIFDAEAMKPTRVLSDILDAASRVKTWLREFNITGLNGPTSFPSMKLAKWNLDERAVARGYPTKLPRRQGWTFDAIHGQRMVHLYWTLLLNLYMTVLDNPILRDILEKNNDSRITNLVVELTARGQQAPPSPYGTTAVNPVMLLFDECRTLANDISLHSTSSCHNVCESFGSLMSYNNLETALSWYEGHREGAGEMEMELEKHCRAMLAGIAAAESREPCAFEVVILPEDVLRRPWC